MKTRSPHDENRLTDWDYEFMSACGIDVAQRIFSDDDFMLAIGSAALDGGQRDAISNWLHERFAKSPKSRQEMVAFRKNVARKYAKHFAESAAVGDSINNAPSAGDCGEPSHTTLSGIPVDGTVQTLQSLGLPITPENWLRLQTMGRFSSVDELDGEVLAELPEWVRGTFEEDLGLTEQ